jgi:hypothetical protein
MAKMRVTVGQCKVHIRQPPCCAGIPAIPYARFFDIYSEISHYNAAEDEN